MNIDRTIALDMVQKVNNMRSLQKAYFKSNKDPLALSHAKQAEKEVDELLIRILGVPQQPKGPEQKSLF